jgi:hypothetical protein
MNYNQFTRCLLICGFHYKHSSLLFPSAHPILAVAMLNVKVAVVPDTKRKSACREMRAGDEKLRVMYTFVCLKRLMLMLVCVCVCAPFPSFRQTGPKQICRYLAFFTCSHSKLSLEKYKKINRAGTHRQTRQNESPDSGSEKQI